jgi:hypothetical protein
MNARTRSLVRLAYGTVELAPDGQSDERHVYLLNVDSDLKPQRLDESKSASQPAIVGNDVVWKESDPALSFDVGGGLVHYSLSTAERETLNLRPGAPMVINGYGAGFLWPSIGAGYVAAWTDSFDGDRVLNLTALQGGGLLTDPRPRLAACGPRWRWAPGWPRSGAGC